MAAIKISGAELRALFTGLDQGAAFPVSIQMRTGGSYSRMVERMVGKGLFAKRPPYAITAKGRDLVLRRGCRQCRNFWSSGIHRMLCLGKAR